MVYLSQCVKDTSPSHLMSKQRECCCHCDSCIFPCDESDSVVIHLYQEIDSLKRQVAERDYHIVQMEASVVNHAKDYPNNQSQALQETLRFWQEKYDRLAESHRKLQKVNQSLEDKLLRIVDKFESERITLTRDVADLTSKLVEARVTINEIEEENEHYKNDCTIAVNLLQCKPSNFVSYKVNSLPSDLQEKIRVHYANYNQGKQRRSLSIGNGLTSGLTKNSNGLNGLTGNGNGKIIRVPISKFPPTAMVYSVNNKVNEESSSDNNYSCKQSKVSTEPDYVSAAIMAKILEERSKERLAKNGSRYQKCRQCRQRCLIIPYYDASTQTKNGVLNSNDWSLSPSSPPPPSSSSSSGYHHCDVEFDENSCNAGEGARGRCSSSLSSPCLGNLNEHRGSYSSLSSQAPLSSSSSSSSLHSYMIIHFNNNSCSMVK